ncbi:MAG: 3'-5' exonuclease [Candidatus Thermoplasmatota archaeon]|nr:3'-5' exonuclease [Candidatus Thermoplasmatota archaeon]
MKYINEIIVVDIETTGFLKQQGLIVEIGMVKLNLETGKRTIMYDELVKEEGFDKRHQHAWIFQNSDLCFEKVLKAPPLDYSLLQELFNTYPATAYNKRFDFDFLNDRGLKIKELDCPMKLSTTLCKLPGYYGYKWPTVQEAYNFFFEDNDYVELHRACDDAFHESEIVWELYKQGIFQVPNIIV